MIFKIGEKYYERVSFRIQPDRIQRPVRWNPRFRFRFAKTPTELFLKRLYENLPVFKQRSWSYILRKQSGLVKLPETLIFNPARPQITRAEIVRFLAFGKKPRDLRRRVKRSTYNLLLSRFSYLNWLTTNQKNNFTQFPTFKMLRLIALQRKSRFFVSYLRWLAFRYSKPSMYFLRRKVRRKRRHPFHVPGLRKRLKWKKPRRLLTLRLGRYRKRTYIILHRGPRLYFNFTPGQLVILKKQRQQLFLRRGYIPIHPRQQKYGITAKRRFPRLRYVAPKRSFRDRFRYRQKRKPKKRLFLEFAPFLFTLLRKRRFYHTGLQIIYQTRRRYRHRQILRKALTLFFQKRDYSRTSYLRLIFRYRYVLQQLFFMKANLLNLLPYYSLRLRKQFSICKRYWIFRKQYRRRSRWLKAWRTKLNFILRGIRLTAFHLKGQRYALRLRKLTIEIRRRHGFGIKRSRARRI